MNSTRYASSRWRAAERWVHRAACRPHASSLSALPCPVFLYSCFASSSLFRNAGALHSQLSDHCSLIIDQRSPNSRIDESLSASCLLCRANEQTMPNEDVISLALPQHLSRIVGHTRHGAQEQERRANENESARRHATRRWSARSTSATQRAIPEELQSSGPARLIWH